ncbi:hypothetical protein PHAMO_80026 [Magnetospirillum molischianum DSM 120]|uniref:Uncharacterized protein n=1 Tax=Magnetospirillum molischianum DSM 120 TaxID=1150626 RepID=H8FXZ7_MAGML|nr:hypothetical protein PHAMO_80026 [Magnetospirillum molischianum DSM 120]
MVKLPVPSSLASIKCGCHLRPHFWQAILSAIAALLDQLVDPAGPAAVTSGPTGVIPFVIALARQVSGGANAGKPDPYLSADVDLARAAAFGAVASEGIHGSILRRQHDGGHRHPVIGVAISHDHVELPFAFGGVSQGDVLGVQHVVVAIIGDENGLGAGDVQPHDDKFLDLADFVQLGRQNVEEPECTGPLGEELHPVGEEDLLVHGVAIEALSAIELRQFVLELADLCLVHVTSVSLANGLIR